MRTATIFWAGLIHSSSSGNQATRRLPAIGMDPASANPGIVRGNKWFLNYKWNFELGTLGSIGTELNFTFGSTGSIPLIGKMY